MNTPETNTPAIEISDLACTFISGDGKKESHYTAVRDVNLSIRAGEFVSIVGPTGCGKSTILNMTAGLLKPSHGTIPHFRRAAFRAEPTGRVYVPGGEPDAVAKRARERDRRT